MFEQSVLPDSHSKRPSWFIAAISAEPLFVAVAIAVPLLTIPRLAPPRLPTALHFMRQITAVKLIRADAVHIPVAGKTPLPISPRVLVAPSRIPHHVAPAVDVPSALDYVVVPGTGNSSEGVWGAVEGSTNVPGPPPPAFAPRAHAIPPAPVRVSRGVQEAKLINKVMPQYPRLALQTRQFGTVRLIATVGKDGRIRKISSNQRTKLPGFRGGRSGEAVDLAAYIVEWRIS